MNREEQALIEKAAPEYFSRAAKDVDQLDSGDAVYIKELALAGGDEKAAKFRLIQKRVVEILKEDEAKIRQLERDATIEKERVLAEIKRRQVEIDKRKSFFELLYDGKLSPIWTYLFLLFIFPAAIQVMLFLLRMNLGYTTGHGPTDGYVNAAIAVNLELYAKIATGLYFVVAYPTLGVGLWRSMGRLADRIQFEKRKGIIKIVPALVKIQLLVSACFYAYRFMTS